ncbi:MAG: TonB-dependent receptor, partial [Gemmatimonadetes bacterium]|nr:TonB-dependent receptor [Gemmatimonadota bacterium]
SKAIITREEIAEMPVQELQDIVALQAGVVEGHFRGGRLGEVQFQVDGVSVNNVFDNKIALRLDRSLLEEVQVLSGTFDAEYGQAMSGVVNTVLKTGTDRFTWEAEAFSGGYYFPGGEDRRPTDDGFRAAGVQNYAATLTGPLPLPKTYYLLNVRRYHFDNHVSAHRVFRPTDEHDLEEKIFNPTGDRARVPLGYTREWSGAAKITNKSIRGVQVNYQIIANELEGQRSDWAYRYNPEGLATQKTVSVAHGVDVTHSFGSATFYRLSLRHNYHDYQDLVYDDVLDPRYLEAGPPQTDDAYETGAIIQGVDFGRFKQKTNTYIGKFSMTSQVNRNNLIKGGVEIQYPRVVFGEPGRLEFITDGGQEILSAKTLALPEYRPVVGSAFLQDQIEWERVTLRPGIRLDYFDARGSIPSDLSNPANTIEGAPESAPEETSRKTYVSPRIGVAYPINERAGIHFSYGHFIQFPPIGEVFSNADYSVVGDIQAGVEDRLGVGVLGNPDIEPEKTVQYEFGYKQSITDDLGMDITIFYKDVRDLLGVEFVTTYNVAEYARLTNIDFGNVVGFTLAFDQRRIGMLRTELDYTWQLARGNSSDPRETADREAAGEDPRPRQIPFDWDQRHTFNAVVSLSRPENFNVTSILRVASGTPFTPLIESGFGFGLETNSGRKPASVLVDMRAEKTVSRNAHLFLRVFNLFDTRFFNGSVFPSTGSPYYSRFPTADEVALGNPTRFQDARRIELGLKIGAGN